MTTRADGDRGGDPSAPAAPGLDNEERELLARLLGGDEAAFETLVARHQASLERVARLFVSSPAVAEEVVQETWLAVLQGLRAFEGRSSLKTWIFRILSNRAKTRGKREGRMVPFPTVGGGGAVHGESGDEAAVDAARFSADGHWRDPPRSWGTESPEELLLRAEVRATIERALGELPEAQRAVVTLRDVEGFTSDEACALLELSEANQRVLLHRGRSRVRRALEGTLDRGRKSR